MQSQTSRFLLSGVALAAALAVTPARAESSNALRFLAVGGSLASWATAFWNGAPLTDCANARWQTRALLARDGELNLLSAGAAYGDCQMLSMGGWTLSHQTSAMVGRWTAKGTVSGADSAWDVAVVPLLHWQRPAFGGHRMEVEVGVGPAWLSEPHIGDRYKSTQFQFSDHLGVNLVDGSGRWRVGLHWRHISNLDIQTPNNGVDYAGVVLAWTL
ncbi:acyloxyacyl hydrolase [Ideonella sp.]|uniref:acyloxyacyl hydrolase n=1 Tax=Ideonella sp. TaxID=1929293 RepID=UPI003BB7B0AD